MSIRYFATNRDRENLGRDIERNTRIRLQEGGYHWIDTTAYMSYYLATTETQRMPSSSIIVNSQEIVFDNFLNLPSIKNIIICVHGFNTELHQALTAFSILTDALNEISELRGNIIVDPEPSNEQEKAEIQGKLQNDANNLTAVLGFSWPSNGAAGPSDYNSDRQDAAYSATALANLISIIRSNHPTVKIHLLAHSMGNFLVCTMLEMLVYEQIFTLAQARNLPNKDLIERQLKRRDQGGEGVFFVDSFIMLAPDVERRHVTQCDKHDAQNNDPNNPKAYYLGPFYAGLRHLVGGAYLYYSRYDQALKLSQTEKDVLREFPDNVLRRLTFQGVNPDNLWENSLGLNPAPELSPSNLYSYNASTLSNRAIDHGDYFDTPDIVKKIAELIVNYR